MAAKHGSDEEALHPIPPNKKPLPLICVRNAQYYYFDAILGRPDWVSKKILDFGGNVGGFLMGAPSTIKHNDYWCIDLCKAALERGQRMFSRAHFVFYNRYNCHYNPSGIIGLPVPKLGQMFDFVFAFSVFTHTSLREMAELFSQLITMLNPRGTLAFTFCDPHYDPAKDPGYNMKAANPQVGWGSNLKHRLRWKMEDYPWIDAESLIEQANNAQTCVLVGDRFYVDADLDMPVREKLGVHYDQFHTVAYMKELFPKVEIFPPVSPERQHCCVFRQ